MEENLFIYILRLESNKYYIGKTKDLFARFESHRNGAASNWTKKYKPLFVERVIEKASIFDEDKYTKEYMNKHGIDNVRGGAYVMEILPQDQIISLMREMTAATDCCFNCKIKGHFILNCTNKNNIINNNNYNNNINNNNNIINNNNITSTKIISNKPTENNNNNNIITSTKIVNNKPTTENNYNPTKNNYSKNNKQNNYKTTNNNETKKSDVSNKGKKWTPNEDNDLCKFYESGISITEIAKIHQRTEYAIKKRLQKLGKLD